MSDVWNLKLDPVTDTYTDTSSKFCDLTLFTFTVKLTLYAFTILFMNILSSTYRPFQTGWSYA